MGSFSESSPWSDKQRTLQSEMWRQAMENLTGLRPGIGGEYKGNINVGPSQATERYIQGLQNAARAPGTPGYAPQLHKFEGIQGFDLNLGGDDVRAAAGQLGTDRYLSPDSNPYLRQTVEAATGDVARQFTRQTLPGLQSAAQAQGAYGGSQAQKMATLQQTEAQRGAQQVAAGMYGQNFANERGLMQQGQLALPGFYNTAANLDVTQQTVPRQFAQSERAFAQNQDVQNRSWQVANSDRLRQQQMQDQDRRLGFQSQAGQLTDQFRQRDAQEQMQRYQMEQQRYQQAQQLPWQNLQMASPYAFVNTGQDTWSPDTLDSDAAGGGGGFGGALKGAMGGAAMGAPLGPWGIAGGAVLGAGAGWFA